MKALNEPEFASDQMVLRNFTQAPTNAQLPRYQDIIESLKTSINQANSIAILEAFEKIIMKLVHYEHYMYYSEGKWSNIFFTGIQKPSLSWLTLSTSADISQLMHELKQLAQIARRHSLSLSLRLNNKADSYLYWKTRMLKALAAAAAAGGAYYYRENLQNAFNSASDYANAAYATGANAINSAYVTGADLANAASDLAGSAYSTSADFAKNAYETEQA